MLVIMNWVEGHGFYWPMKSQNLRTILENYIHIVFENVIFFFPFGYLEIITCLLVIYVEINIFLSFLTHPDSHSYVPLFI